MVIISLFYSEKSLAHIIHTISGSQEIVKKVETSLSEPKPPDRNVCNYINL